MIHHSSASEYGAAYCTQGAFISLEWETGQEKERSEESDYPAPVLY